MSYDNDTDCFLNNPLMVGRIGGQALLGTQAIEREIPDNAPAGLDYKAQSPFSFSIPLIPAKFVQQIGVMLKPKALFMPQVFPDARPYYNISNKVKRGPVLVFQSPLDYIGLPPNLE